MAEAVGVPFSDLGLEPSRLAILIAPTAARNLVRQCSLNFRSDSVTLSGNGAAA